jgi:hypothetical protein
MVDILPGVLAGCWSWTDHLKKNTKALWTEMISDRNFYRCFTHVI